MALDEAETQPHQSGQFPEVGDANMEEGEPGAFLLAGQADRGRFFGHGLSDGGPEHQGHAQKQREAGEVLGRAELGPLQLEAKATPLQISQLFLNGIITSDKFCLTRYGRLILSWSRRPLRLR